MDIQNTQGGTKTPGQTGAMMDTVKYDPSKTTFSEVIKETFAIFRKNFVIYAGLFLAAEAVALAVEYLGRMVVPKANTAVYGTLAVLIIIGIVAAVVRLVGYCSILRAAHLADSGKISFTEALGYAAGRFMAEVGLCIRVFFYTGVWLIILVLLLWTGGAFVAMTMGVQLPMLGLITSILPLIAIVLFIIYIRRMLRATFAFPVMLKGENMTGKEALAGSIKLAEGLTGRIFSNYFLLYVVLFIIMMVLTFPAAQFAGSFVEKPSMLGTASAKDYQSSMESLTALILLIPSALMYAFMTLFNYAFMKKAVEAKS